MTMTRRRLLDDSFKKTVEGNPAIATDSLARMYPGIVMQGWTEQEETTGAQLYDQSLAEDNKYQNFDINSKDFSIVPNDGFWITGKIPVKPNTTYTINANAFGAYYSDADTPITTTFKEANPFTTPENANYVCLNLKKSNYPFGSDIMLNEGSTALPWEPYTGGQPSPSPDYPQEIVSAGNWNEEAQKWEYEITITNAQTDPDKNQSVTLTADRPLTKWDGLEKRNGQWGWVYGSAEMTFDGSDDEEWYLYANQTYAGFQITVSDLKEGIRIEGFCDSFPVEIAVSGTDPAIWMIDKTLYFKNVNPKYASNAEEWKTWLQSNNAKVLYQTADETFVPLTTAEQEAMNALHTYRPTTVLSNQQDCDMTLTYKSRKGMS